jgi:UDP-N-acetylglucosamine 2-epimerase (non-hydrolysing)
MIDCYELMRSAIEACHTRERLRLPSRGYGVVTLHRPSNVDDRENLQLLISGLCNVSIDLPLVFPAHPRTRQRLSDFGLMPLLTVPQIQVMDPLGYIEFMSLVSEAKLIITDSGGVQEETTYLGIPCLTLRDSTERPVTISEGTNQLVQPPALMASVRKVLDGHWQKGRIPALWDGHTAERVVESLRVKVDRS